MILMSTTPQQRNARRNARRREVAGYKREAAARRHQVNDPEMQEAIVAAITEAGRPLTATEIETAVRPGFVHGWLSQHVGLITHRTIGRPDPEHPSVILYEVRS